MIVPLLIVVVVVVGAVLILVPLVRRIVALLLTLGIALGATAVALFGLALLMNNVAIDEQPGIQVRIFRFLSVDRAATSATGASLAPCPEGAESSEERLKSAGEGSPARAAKTRRERSAVGGQPLAKAPEASAPGERQEDYPELVRRGYPGLPRAKLLALARETVNQLGGWKVVKEEPRSYTLECVYTTRLLRFEDEVRIVITPRGEIDLCSHSGRGEETGGLRRWLGIGDFGANIGHIKEFYSALEPMVDAAYKEEERRQSERGS